MVNSRSGRVWLISIARTEPFSIPAKITRARVRFAIALAEGIVGIQNNAAAPADRFRQCAFFLRNRFARSHEFDVRDADVGNDGGVRRGHSARARNLSRMIHPNFPDGDFVVRIRLQHGARQSDVIVEIAFGFRDSETLPKDRGREIFRAVLPLLPVIASNFQRQRLR